MACLRERQPIGNFTTLVVVIAIFVELSNCYIIRHVNTKRGFALIDKRFLINGLNYFFDEFFIEI